MFAYGENVQYPLKDLVTADGRYFSNPHGLPKKPRTSHIFDYFFEQLRHGATFTPNNKTRHPLAASGHQKTHHDLALGQPIEAASDDYWPLLAALRLGQRRIVLEAEDLAADRLLDRTVCSFSGFACTVGTLGRGGKACWSFCRFLRRDAPPREARNDENNQNRLDDT